MNLSDNQNTLRTFIAVPMPESIGRFLKKTQNQIRDNGIKASWTKQSSMHLTLRFFGDTTQEEIKQIIQAMKNTAESVEPFTIHAQGIGVFPNIKNTRVIWAGINGQTEPLQKLKKHLEENLAKTGIAPDNKRFSPHFTLGRFKQRPNKDRLIKLIQNFETQASDPHQIESMVLFKSDLKPTGAVHTPIFESFFTSF